MPSHPQSTLRTQVIVLPGLLGSVNGEWSVHFDAIRAAGYEPVGIDLPGHGSNRDELDYVNLESVCDYLLSRIDEVTPNPALIWGYSLGGYLGLEIECRNPGRLSGLWMHATKFYWDDEQVHAFRSELDSTRMPLKRAELLMKMHGDRWSELVEWNRDLFDDIATTGLHDDELDSVRMPVLVTAGDQDEWVPAEEVERLSEALIAGESSIITGVRHPLHSARSSLLLEAALDFSKRT